MATLVFVRLKETGAASPVTVSAAALLELLMAVTPVIEVASTVSVAADAF